ncbi:MAG TPA: PadR family transcriptional regulator [Acidimicrobiales bacterium]|jgi:DNA-binding PadR family transcriptional regulator
MLKFVLLGLLDAEPRYGYELKAVFERFLGGTWPLNIGQVYTALSRMERDGLVDCQVVPQDLLPDRKVYALTGKGRRELRAWLAEPDTGPVSLRDEFFLKIAIASLNDERPREVINRQRTEHLSALAELGRLQHDPNLDPATGLLLEGAMLRLEADLKWLDVCEDRLKNST